MGVCVPLGSLPSEISNLKLIRTADPSCLLAKARDVERRRTALLKITGDGVPRSPCSQPSRKLKGSGVVVAFVLEEQEKQHVQTGGGMLPQRGSVSGKGTVESAVALILLQAKFEKRGRGKRGSGGHCGLTNADGSEAVGKRRS
ncbi:hypothetical protein EYF80_033716 [Liparis tanakae]|uniref:Uncharacterized protein n=1 Tax=Liparis tanakae TaxID=230148 RepID=A0A4Z2GSJ1_9TELE|nr:hypothetical protein EYF80_033716 [Liparis tanakae]